MGDKLQLAGATSLLSDVEGSSKRQTQNSLLGGLSNFPRKPRTPRYVVGYVQRDTGEEKIRDKRKENTISDVQDQFFLSEREIRDPGITEVQQDKIFLFEVEVERDVAGQSTIMLNPQKAIQNNFINNPKDNSTILFLSANEALKWPVRLTHSEFRIEKYKETSNFWVANELKPTDLVQFYKPIKRESSSHFVIQSYSLIYNRTMDDKQENKKKLNIPNQLFDDFRGSKKVNEIVVSMFDEQEKKWDMKAVKYESANKMTGDWKDFCEEKVVEGTQVKIYKAKGGNKFLIRIA